MNTRNTDLDRLRLVCDPIVDALVDQYVRSQRPGHSGRLLGTLFKESSLPKDHPLVLEYMHTLKEAPRGSPRDNAVVARGQRLFELFGPEMLLILGSYALPLAYAAGGGVQVVYRARKLKEDPIRRLCDTAQMIINVMQVDGLEEEKIGWRATRKVRLIHALVRNHIKTSDSTGAEGAWQAEWGEPINQEDLAGTLMTFSVGVLHGLRLMGAKLSPEDADAYVVAWAAIGQLLGVDEALLPTSEATAAELAMKIGARQIRATPEGKELNNQLLGAVGSLFPIEGYALSLTHFFLRETIFGANVAGALDLPPANWTRHLVTARAAQKRIVLTLLDKIPGARRRRSFMAGRFAQRMILLKRPDDNVPFEVPRGLLDRWGLRGAASS